MAFNFKKTSTKISTPQAKPSGSSKFAHVSAPKQAPLKTRIYTKDTLREDPSKFGNIGFGNTGLSQTPLVPPIGIGYKK